jgi:transposase
MPKRQELTDFERGEIVGLFKGGFAYRKISEILGHPTSTIGDIIKKYNDKGLTTTMPRSGRPAKTSERDNRHLIKVVKESRKSTLKEITEDFNIATNTSVSTRTIQRILHKEGYSGHAAKKKPFISEKNRKKRYGWSRMRKNWITEWESIIWSDESRFELFNNDSNNWIWRKTNERYNVECLNPTVKKSKGIMVWGCFCNNKLGPLVLVEGTLNSDRYIELLENYLLPFLINLNEKEETLIPWYFFQEEDYIFQDDNASCHVSNKTKSWKENKLIKTLPWPAQSPDLNPIENLWDILERRVRKYKPMPSTKNDFFELLKREWYQIDEGELTRLVKSMPNRINNVIKSKGNPTKY